MQIDLDTRAGFCFGVQNAIEIAEKELRAGNTVYSLGQIVHNEMEISRLEKMGLITIDHEQYKHLKDARVLIRAHGEPPETYRIARENNIHLIDATCPIVAHLQNKIRTCYDEIRKEKGQVVIFGKKGHAEVIGLIGQTGNTAIVINSEEDLEKIDYHKPVYLYSQTTRDIHQYEQLKEEIQHRIRAAGDQEPASFISYNTICSQVSNRAPELEAFAHNHDLMIFVSGRNSSNGKYLYDICRKTNPNTLFVSLPEELELPLPGNPQSVGISGATSTPGWLMEKIREKIKAFYHL
jgi:4-hydroxy-3-methylbut-2-enyl diphosphate reductase